MPSNPFNIQGLTDRQVIASREKHGKNTLAFKNTNEFCDALLRIIKEPMMILLLTAAFIYFISGKTGDGIFLAMAIMFQISISLFQHSRSKNALDKLKDFSQPKCRVIRDDVVLSIDSMEVVIGDSLMVEEGTSVVADGKIVHSNDFSVNESVLTGESMPVFKDQATKSPYVFLGTTVASGLAIVTVTSIGNNTKLGKIGTSLESINEEKTPLEIQIENFVTRMAIAGVVVFIIVWAINYFHSQNFLYSLLQSLTLAMSILPEEIPVAFTTFMALGAWRLMKMGIVVKQMKTVETLGSATVICTDKTGTLTENRMSLAKLFVLSSREITDPWKNITEAEKELVKTAMWASEPIPFDSMELALHEAYQKFTSHDERPDYKMIHEYPLDGKPPMMTHIFKSKNGDRIIAAKGAVEAMIAVSNLNPTEKKSIFEIVKILGNDGYRLLGVGISGFDGNYFPVRQQELSFRFLGIVAFYDPPKANIRRVLENFYSAGIAVKILTGDHTETTTAIAKQIGLRDYEKHITGDDLMQMDETTLRDCVGKTSVFTRMFPEAKLRIINALKSDGQIVAMTGDGVNDGPALKAAHIGIAMGRKGTEIAKQAASLILLEDDLSKMVDAIAMGRKIYTNLKKAIQYIISIHIPIILTVFIPLAMGWLYPNIFSPLHIIFLELIMGPTCSIIYENEPMEKNTMFRKPKPMSVTFFNWSELSVSILQGLMITVATLFVYRYAVDLGYSEGLTRTMVFTVLITANIFLTLVNRSFYYSIAATFRYNNNMIPAIILITVAVVGLLLFLKPLTAFFAFETPNLPQLLLSIGVGSVSVMWYEIVKWFKRYQTKKMAS